MKVWAVNYESDMVSEELYQAGLELVDKDSATRIRKFFHRADACRTLIGRLLPRMLLRERNISLSEMTFSKTSAGKPYTTTQELHPPMAFNISHDNEYVVMAHGPGLQDPPAFSLGVDVMKVRVPGRESFHSFVHTVQDQLTLLERRSVLDVPQETGLENFFWLWTMKEAYTKALGLGLGFDFRRVEFDLRTNTVQVDGQEPAGWTFRRFKLMNRAGDPFVGVVAEYVGDGRQCEVVFDTKNKLEWLKVIEADKILTEALERLKL